MKDQKELLKKCLVNDIPAIVFQGSDSCGRNSASSGKHL